MSQTFVNEEVDWKNILLGEILVFELLNKTLQTYPETDWIRHLIDESVFDESPLESGREDVARGLSILRDWCEKQRGKFSQVQSKNLQADYTRLFVGVERVIAPPWESVYFNEGRLMFQGQTIQVRNWYRRFGLEPEKLREEPDDHIGLEFAFISHLSKMALEAFAKGDSSEFQEIIQAKKEFIQEHPARWVLTWSHLVEQHAQTEFYLGLGILARGMLLTVADIYNIEGVGEPLK